ncbi:Lysosomal alpha-glucosidase [Halotydeus destructor]|nr:Lysosomal alpha-glucosidase [Halotydeus destructor]
MSPLRFPFVLIFVIFCVTKLNGYPTKDSCSLIVDNDKFDCHPDDNVSEKSCLSRGCCWKPGPPGQPQPTVPWCHFAANSSHGYKEVYRSHAAGQLTILLGRRGPSGFPRDVDQVLVQVTNIDQDKVRIRMTDVSRKRFEVSLPPLNLSPKFEQEEPKYEIHLDKNSRLKVVRKTTGTAILDIDLTTLIYSDQYLQISSKLPAKYLYGIGEHYDTFRKEVTWKKYSLLNSDRPPVRGEPLYGSHPFYLMPEEDGVNCHGVLMFNNHPMDILLQPTPGVTFKMIGGIVDLFVFLGPSAPTVVRQYVSLIGKPDLPPYWGLGFHLSRYGYGSLNETKMVLQRNLDHGVPIEAQWNDIDSLDKRNDFMFNNVTFKGLPEYVDHLHGLGIKYVPIIDYAISGAEDVGTYQPLDQGLKMNIFIKNTSDELFIGKVWNDVYSIFPDFTHPLAARWWAMQLERYHERVPFDGAWIDMNEPSNSVNGQYDPITSTVIGCPNNSLEYPPFCPGTPEPLSRNTICMSAKQYAGPHYDLHNMAAIYETKATKEALIAITGKRQFIISRASVTGQGVYGMHWSGDIVADWDPMRWTIPSILDFNLFGMPLVGADICGFNGNTTSELCARWQALGAFYPFSRNHNSDDCHDQDPAFEGFEGDVLKATKYALNIRYTILPYIYTLFYRAAEYGDTVARPLFFEFPDDPVAYEVETQFMLGKGVMVVPCLEQGMTKVKGYFPKGLWYDDHELLFQSSGDHFVVDMPLDRILIARRGGSIIANLPPKATTDEQRRQPFEFSVYLDQDGGAIGQLYWDDGQSPDSLLLGQFSLVDMVVSRNNMTFVSVANGYLKEPFVVSAVHIYGALRTPSSVMVNNQLWSHHFYATSKLDIYNLSLDLNQVQSNIIWNY